MKTQELHAIVKEVGDAHFIMCVAHLMDVGYRSMTEENVKATIEEISKQNDEHHILSNEFKIFVVETAYKIATVANPIDLVKFASRFV